MLKPWLRDVIAAVVAAAWVANTAADAFVPTYQPIETINGAFVIIIGAVYTLSAIRSGRNGNGDSKREAEKKSGDSDAS